jgi:dTDP-4-amino-4,6-dideoxygalactose transaminase
MMARHSSFVLSSGARPARTAAKFLPFHMPLIEDEEIQAVTDVLKSGWITTGPKVREFEESFAAYTGARHAVALNSGTSALHLALKVVGVDPGDEVVLPTMTFAATAEVAVYLGARPVFVDCEPDTLNIDPRGVERAITARTKAIVPVHFAGQPCEMDRLLEIAGSRGIKVVEDAAHALPARYRGKMIGTLGDITCFSFYATKTITTGEGGMAATENASYADRMRTLSLHGMSRDAWNRYTANGCWRYDILEAGYKYNLTDLQAALGVAQLGKCDAMWRRRAEIAERYTRGLAPLDAFRTPRIAPHVQHAWHLYVIRVDDSVLRIHRDHVMEELRQDGIGASVHFIPLHQLSYYKEEWSYRHGDFPVAEHYFDRCISLPIYPLMTDEDADRVVESLAGIAARYRR